MRVCGVLLLLSAAARGLVSKAGSESQSPTEQRRLQRQNLPLHDRNGLGLTPPGLFCRGGSAATGRGEAAGCLAKQVAGRGALPVAAAGSEKPLGAKQGWGQLRRSPEAGGSLSTELASRGGANAAASAEQTKSDYRTALLRTGLLVCSAGAFGLGTWVVKGKTSALEFFAGYIVEQSLSVDNLFIFIMLFDYFKVPAEFQSRVLNWGIIGAVSMRAIMIVVGVAAIQRFRGVMLVFAGILVVSSIKLLLEGAEDEHDSAALEGNMVLRIANWMMDSVDYYDGEHFFTLVNGAKKATPLLLCLICIEMTDFVFAVDSIPAVLAISHDTFIVYASNVFAICAMRSIYTLVSHAISDLPYLKPAVALVLGFVGGKMFAEFFHYDISVGASLAVVCGILGAGAAASVVSNRRRDRLAAGASSVSGGGSSGLTFESFSAAAGQDEGHGDDLPPAAAAAADADTDAASDTSGGEEAATIPTSLEDGKAVVGDKLAWAGDRAAAAASAAGDAADAATTDVAYSAGGAADAEATEKGEYTVGEEAASVAKNFVQGVEEAAELLAADVEEDLSAVTPDRVVEGEDGAEDDTDAARERDESVV